MDHKVASVQDLYEDAKMLFTNYVVGTEETSADTIISNLGQSIDILKSCWEGKDAGVQINNIVSVFNGMVSVRNALVLLCNRSSSIAANYREIQNANGAGLEQLTPVNTDDRTKLPEYVDTRDTINISSQANDGKARLDAANNAIDGFIGTVNSYYEKIMANWTVGSGRDEAREAFDTFLRNSQSYKNTLNDVSNSIATAVKNYNF